MQASVNELKSVDTGRSTQIAEITKCRKSRLKKVLEDRTETITTAVHQRFKNSPKSSIIRNNDDTMNQSTILKEQSPEETVRAQRLSSPSKIITRKRLVQLSTGKLKQVPNSNPDRTNGNGLQDALIISSRRKLFVESPSISERKSKNIGTRKMALSTKRTRNTLQKMVRQIPEKINTGEIDSEVNHFQSLFKPLRRSKYYNSSEGNSSSLLSPEKRPRNTLPKSSSYNNSHVTFPYKSPTKVKTKNPDKKKSAFDCIMSFDNIPCEIEIQKRRSGIRNTPQKKVSQTPDKGAGNDENSVVRKPKMNKRTDKIGSFMPKSSSYDSSHVTFPYKSPTKVKMKTPDKKKSTFDCLMSFNIPCKIEIQKRRNGIRNTPQKKVSQTSEKGDSNDENSEARKPKTNTRTDIPKPSPAKRKRNVSPSKGRWNPKIGICTVEMDPNCSSSPFPSPFKAPTNMKLRRSPRKITKRPSYDYNTALDNILNEIENQKKRDDNLKKIEQNLYDVMKDEIAPDSKRTCSYEIEGDRLSETLQQPNSRFSCVPPGLKILEPDRCFPYFSSVEDIFDGDAWVEENSQKVKALLEFPVHFLPEAIERQGFLQLFTNGSPLPSILLFLFRLIAIHESYTVVESCKKTIEHYMLTCQKDFKWCPLLGDIIVVILNYGSGIQDHCPLREQFVEKQSEMFHKWSSQKSVRKYRLSERSVHICNCKKKHVKIVNYHNLNAVIEVLGSFINRWNTYSSTHLSQLILLLCWLSLDQALLAQNVAPSIQTCIDSALSKIVEDKWTSELVFLSRKLASISSHHSDIMYLVRLLPPSRRGIQLQQSLCYTALQILMNEDPTVRSIVTPKDILKLLKQMPILQTPDHHSLYNIVSMIDVALRSNVANFQVAVRRISNLLLKTYAKINDSFMCIEKTQLKNLLVTTRSKWFLLMKETA